ncbi:hypothetical protein Sste5346_007736 [Sporothrix stenoceras]|uniref:RBR-type E3 ubiquitin transferase n=1 Tax=Sporothrix stenoceras TaxID=5173 RepID=A0ABR3YTQ5_9PEZI
MNNREAAIAALLRQGWVPTSQVAAANPTRSPSTSTPTSPVERRQQQQHLPTRVPPQPPLNEISPPPEPTPSPQPSLPTQTAASSAASISDVSSDLASNFTLIDLTDETILDNTTDDEDDVNATDIPVTSPRSSAPTSSRESLASTVQSASSGESNPEPEQQAEEKETVQGESQLEVVADLVDEDDSELFAPIPDFTIANFSTTPALAACPAIPPTLHDWILCSEVGLQFMRPARQRIIMCVACGQDCEDGAGTDGTEHVFRSTFWRMTTCRAGHRPPELNNRRSGFCKSCDKDYVLQVVRGEHRCRHEGCRRVLRVDLFEVEDALWDHPGLWTAFSTLIQTNSTYECAIHADDVSDADNDTDLTPECDHDRNACGSCLTQLCEAAIKGDRLNDLVCPEPACRKPLTRDAVRELVSADSLRLYDKKLAFIIMSRNPNFRWCRCGHGQIHATGESQPEWTCTACNTRHCFICQDAESGFVCEHLRCIDNERALQRLREEHERSRGTSDEMQRQRQLAQQAALQLAIQARENTRGTQIVIATTAKRCPRLGCRVPIQRDEGCGHMTCRRCGTEFCWACKVIWRAPLQTAPGASSFANAARGGPSATVLLPLHLPTCQLATNRTISRRRLNLTQYATGWDVDQGYDQELDNDLWLQADQQ